MKKQLKKMLKELKEPNYVEPNLDPKVELNIDFARRSMAGSIYKQSVLERIVTTYADTETIIEGGNVNNMSSEDVHKNLYLKHAWQFILNREVISSPVNSQSGESVISDSPDFFFFWTDMQSSSVYL